jgi:hypothetical protein
MKLSIEAESYLSRYFYAIQTQLHGKQRDDIVAELKSNLLDSMEKEYPGSTLIDKTLIQKILLENGSPRKVAEEFHGPRYLIGPKLYPFFSQVLSIVLTVLATILVIVFLVGAFMNPWPAGAAFGNILEFIGGLWSALLTSAAIIILVFSIIERQLPDRIDEFDEDSWKPDDLPEIAHPKDIRVFEHAFGIVGGIVWIMILIYLMNVGEIYAWVDGEKTLIGTITAGFKSLLPFFITISGLELANHFIILSQHMVTAFSHWFKLILDLLNVTLLGFVLSVLPLISFSWQGFPEALHGQFQILEPMIQKSMTGVIALIFGITLISLILEVYREVARKPSKVFQG